MTRPPRQTAGAAAVASTAPDPSTRPSRAAAIAGRAPPARRPPPPRSIRGAHGADAPTATAPLSATAAGAPRPRVRVDDLPDQMMAARGVDAPHGPDAARAPSEDDPAEMRRWRLQRRAEAVAVAVAVADRPSTWRFAAPAETDDAAAPASPASRLRALAAGGLIGVTPPPPAHAVNPWRVARCRTLGMLVAQRRGTRRLLDVARAARARSLSDDADVAHEEAVAREQHDDRATVDARQGYGGPVSRARQMTECWKDAWRGRFAAELFNALSGHRSGAVNDHDEQHDRDGSPFWHADGDSPDGGYDDSGSTDDTSCPVRPLACDAPVGASPVASVATPSAGRMGRGLARLAASASRSHSSHHSSSGGSEPSSARPPSVVVARAVADRVRALLSLSLRRRRLDRWPRFISQRQEGVQDARERRWREQWHQEWHAHDRRDESADAKGAGRFGPGHQGKATRRAWPRPEVQTKETRIPARGGRSAMR